MLQTSFATDAHPTQDQLADFGRGTIEEKLAETIEHHLTDCAACVRRLEGTHFDDPWLALLRAAGPPHSPSAESPAITLGYELEALIGQGGMGVVHRARQLGLERRVALKTVAAGRDASPQVIERFRREFEAVASLNHPAIVPIHDVGIRDGVPFYAMELLEGGSLADRLAGGPLPINDSVALLERLARAVHYAHGRGIIHRDLKPSNILFDAFGAAKVADFGLAKRLDDDPEAAATRTSLLLGTPSYMAPEQAGGRLEVLGPAVDVHALGAILFECLVGRPPFVASTPLETLDLIRTAEPPNPSRFRTDLPADLRTICLTCLEKDPGRRYGSPRFWPTTSADSGGARQSSPGLPARLTGPSSGPAAGPPRLRSPPCLPSLRSQRLSGCSPTRQGSARPSAGKLRRPPKRAPGAALPSPTTGMPATPSRRSWPS